MGKKLWFKAKTYGWGWTPSSWEGWLVTGLYIVVFFLYIRGVLDKQLNGDYGAPLYYHLFIVFVTVVLLVTCYRKGEKPSWRWGKKKN